MSSPERDPSSSATPDYAALLAEQGVDARAEAAFELGALGEYLDQEALKQQLDAEARRALYAAARECEGK